MDMSTAAPGDSLSLAHGPAVESAQINVSGPERLLSTLGGSGLIVAGLRIGGRSGNALALLGGMLLYRGATGHCKVYEVLNINTAHERGLAAAPSRTVFARVSCTVDRPAEECYQFLRDFNNLPRFKNHLISVERSDETHWLWRVRSPGGKLVTREVEVLADEPNTRIAWQSRAGSEIHASGCVHLAPAPGNRGTEVTLDVRYPFPGGHAGASLGRLLGHSPEDEARDDMRRFKQIMEAGELATVAGQSSCRDATSGDGRMRRRRRL